MEIEVLKVKNLADLLKAILTDMKNDVEVKSTNSTDKVKDLDYYITKIAKRKDWKFEEAVNWLESINEEYPVAAFSIVLKEIAIDLDKKYSDNIRDSEHIYVISTVNGRVIEVNKADIRNYKNFAAFRTIDDAKFACKVLREPLKSMGFIKKNEK